MPKVRFHVASKEGAVDVEIEDESTSVTVLATLALGIAEKLADVAEPPATTN
jgi:hypothetical protein